MLPKIVGVMAAVAGVRAFEPGVHVAYARKLSPWLSRGFRQVAIQHPAVQSNLPALGQSESKSQLKTDDIQASTTASATKQIDWYTELPVTAAAIEFAASSGLVQGVMPCCNLLQINCTTGTLQYPVSEYNFSMFGPFLEAGISVSISLEGIMTNEGGMASCCRSATDCTMLQNKELLANQLLELALKYKLTSFTGELNTVQHILLHDCPFPGKSSQKKVLPDLLCRPPSSTRRLGVRSRQPCRVLLGRLECVALAAQQHVKQCVAVTALIQTCSQSDRIRSR